MNALSFAAAAVVVVVVVRNDGDHTQAIVAARKCSATKLCPHGACLFNSYDLIGGGCSKGRVLENSCKKMAMKVLGVIILFTLKDVFCLKVSLQYVLIWSVVT